MFQYVSIGHLALYSHRNPELYKVDHQFQGKMAKNKPVVILYGEIGSKRFKEFHIKLKSLAESGDIIYVVRHYIRERKGPKVRLSGKLTSYSSFF